MIKIRHHVVLAVFIGALAAAGCGLIQQVQQAVIFTKCEFRVSSVDRTVLAGVPIQGVVKASELKLLDLAKIQALLLKGSLPLDFTVHIEVKNPNPSAAAMNKLAWILYLDDRELTSGLVKDRLEVPAQGGIGALPLRISLDLAKLLSGEGLDSMINLALNVDGEAARPTRVSLKVKPAIQVGGQEIDYPGYLTVKGEFTAETGKVVRDEVVGRLDQLLKTP